MSFARSPSPAATRPISFPRWRAVLAASRQSADLRWRFTTEIRRFLKYCQILNVPVNRMRAREYLAIVPLVSARPDARLALQWYFRAARVARHHRPTRRATVAGQTGGSWVEVEAPWLGRSVPPAGGTAAAPAEDFDHACDYP